QGLLRPGMVAEGNIAVGLKGTPFVIPRTAIIDTGKRKIVWLEGKSSSAFKAHSIKTGFESDGYVEVISGLNEGQNVVIDGNFLLDAQAQLFGGYEDFKNAH
ncbi:MAG: efflux RND transporter periplasmic adaptor subunit, partial [Bacteriovoracaceae bacterium]